MIIRHFCDCFRYESSLGESEFFYRYALLNPLVEDLKELIALLQTKRMSTVGANVVFRPLHEIKCASSNERSDRNMLQIGEDIVTSSDENWSWMLNLLS